MPSNSFDEFPAIELVHAVLGLRVHIVQSYTRHNHYWLQMECHRENGPTSRSVELDLSAALDGSQTKEELFPNRVYLDAYIATLIAEVPDVQVC